MSAPAPNASENVLNWVAPAPPPVVRPPRYRSQHDPLTPPYAASSTFVRAAQKSTVGGIGRSVGSGGGAFLRAHAKTGGGGGGGGGGGDDATTTLRECLA
jgi:hypothetical protein